MGDIWYSIRNWNPHLKVLMLIAIFATYVYLCVLTQGLLLIATLAAILLAGLYSFLYLLVTGQL